MGTPPKTPIKKTPVAKTPKIKQPHLVFYRVPVLDAIKRGDREELATLLNGARELQKEFGSFDKLIASLEGAANKAGRG